MSPQSTDEKRQLLEMVAEGKVTPEEAAKLLNALSAEAAPARPTDALEGSVTAVKVIGTFRTVKVTGDSSVEGAVAEGSHKVRLSDETLIFEDDINEDEDGYTLFGPGRVTRRKGFDMRINNRKFQWGQGFDPSRPPVLRIRMNPSLPLSLELMAGTAKVSGVKSEIKAKIAAGTAKFEGITGPIQINVEAGSVHVDGKLTHGESEISCTAGKVRVQLDPSSHVHVVAKSTLGRISLPHEYSSNPEWSGLGGAEREATIGKGTARLNVSAVTGSVQVEVGP